MCQAFIDANKAKDGGAEIAAAIQNDRKNEE
jgi:hypothetical protein